MVDYVSALVFPDFHPMLAGIGSSDPLRITGIANGWVILTVFRLMIICVQFGLRTFRNLGHVLTCQHSLISIGPLKVAYPGI